MYSENLFRCGRNDKKTGGMWLTIAKRLICEWRSRFTWTLFKLATDRRTFMESFKSRKKKV